jgi:hypothetical protein
MNKQVNISMPRQWYDQLESLSRLYSVQQNKTLSHIDLIRSAIQEKYNLSGVIENRTNK